MAGPNWKSDAAATVIHPLVKREREIRLNGTGGVKLFALVDAGAFSQRSGYSDLKIR